MLIDCLLARLPVNGKVFVVKFLRIQKLYRDFRLCRGSVPLIPTLFHGQVYDAISKYKEEPPQTHAAFFVKPLAVPLRLPKQILVIKGRDPLSQ